MNYRGKRKQKGALISTSDLAKRNQYISGNTGDIQTTYASQLPDQKVIQANDPVKIAEKKKQKATETFNKLRRVPSLRLYGDKELKQISEKPRSEWSENVRSNLEDMENQEYRITMHPDYNPALPIDKQMNLNDDNSLRTRILRGRNIFMNSSSGSPLVDLAAKTLASPGSSFANLSLDAKKQYIDPGPVQGLTNLSQDRS